MLTDTSGPAAGSCGTWSGERRPSARPAAGHDPPPALRAAASASAARSAASCSSASPGTPSPATRTAQISIRRGTRGSCGAHGGRRPGGLGCAGHPGAAPRPAPLARRAARRSRRRSRPSRAPRPAPAEHERRALGREEPRACPFWARGLALRPHGRPEDAALRG